LGKRQDHTAIAVVERVRYMVSHQNLRGRCVMAVDATGVGEPVVDMLRSGQLGCEVSAANITGEERETRSGNGQHDDLAMALALACRRAKRTQIGFGTRRLPGI
jgi:hypothetical protein